ncbi:MarR family winged helix-turn-helix transcriptional regulator [Tahibacter amnicola]|uniref:MarR family transcriptional regulator n=1 Tax=Tahibacter amnicola TaxID=2976241 RepID=A0ABY6B8T5_9GAMM|nr:MarR family transcriptional regulator [Tahibacter amnicola]UXI66483.1 MarR family transcriptional regulator [Tahibacter amnicola]
MSQSPEDVLELLHSLFHAIKARHAQVLRDEEDGLAPMEARALNFVARNPGCTAADIAQKSGRDKAQVARLIKTLTERGLLTRQTDDADRRSQRLALTVAGRALQKKVQGHRRRLAADLVADLSPAEQDRLASYLTRLNARMAPGDGSA